MSAIASWRFGGFELDSVDRRLIRDGKIISVPPKAFDVLTLLVKNAGRLVKRQDLFEAVWSGVEVEDANLTNSITALRRILGRQSIVSVPRHGYRFCLPDQRPWAYLRKFLFCCPKRRAYSPSAQQNACCAHATFCG